MAYLYEFKLNANKELADAIESFCKMHDWSRSYFLQRAVLEALRNSSSTKRAAKVMAMDIEIKDQMRRTTYPYYAARLIRAALLKGAESQQVLLLVDKLIEKADAYSAKRLRIELCKVKKELKDTKRYEEIRDAEKQKAIMRRITRLSTVDM